MILLKDIILILFTAIVVILILSKMKIPPVIGFLLTGIIIGPFSFGLVDSVGEIEVLAEIGVILLMFSIGLEFSVDKIKAMMKDFLFFGGLQVAACWLIFFIIINFFGLTLTQSIAGGFILALSSTAIVLKLLQDNDEINSPPGLKMTGILLFQDVVIIPAMIFLPFVNQLGEGETGSIVTSLLIAVGGVILILLLSKYALPFIFKVILKLRIPDLQTVTIFVFLFGVAFISYKLGISLAMGAFIVGIALSDTDYAHQINTDFVPSRHIFNSIFFISIGMFVNVSFFINNIPEVLLFTIIIILVKIFFITLLFVISRNPLSVGIITAFSLAHIGEFSFILLREAQEHKIFSSDTHQVFLSSAILSMFLIPVAIKTGKKIAASGKFKTEIKKGEVKKTLSNHTIIAGYGINGRNISRILKLLDIPYEIIEMNPQTVSEYKLKGEPIRFGSIDHRDNLKHIGIEKASLLIIAINDIEAAKKSVRAARSLSSKVKIIVRVNYISQVETLYKGGADLVLSQDMETSLIFINHILKYYNIPDHVSRIQTNLLREEHYSFFYNKENRDHWRVALLDCIEQDNELFFVGSHSKFVSREIGELEPWNMEGVNVIGVIRNSVVISKELAGLKLEKFDTIIFSGFHKKVYEALHWMEENN